MQTIELQLANLNEQVQAGTDPAQNAAIAEGRRQLAGMASQYDALLEELVEETDDPGAQLSKTGCWITFATIMLVVSGLSIWAIYSFWG